MKERVALLCWEAGAGFGHLVHLSCVAQALHMRGWSCVLALQTASAPVHLDLSRFHIRAAPRWGAGSEQSPVQTRSSASLGDMLAQLGLGLRDWVVRQIGAWHALFAEHRPDLVVADYAPGAVLAARGRVPCVAIGTGYSVPPPGLERFPPLHNLAPVLYDESEVVGTVNSALAAFGTEPLKRLSDVLAGDAACPCTLPLIDPYSEWRAEPALGAILPDPVLRSRPDAEGIFCYMRTGPGIDVLDNLVRCLAALPGPVVANVPDLDRDRRSYLRRSEVELIDGITSVTELIAHSRVVLHGGGHGISSIAVLSGVPQVILQLDVEKMVTARALAKRGLARMLLPDFVDAETLRIAVLSAMDDPVLATEARRAADEGEPYRNRDVAGAVAQICAALA